MDIITKTLIISFAIVGLRIVSSKGMILYFLRMPYEWLNELENPTNSAIFYKGMLKPIIGCTTCMASVWTLIIDYTYFNNFNEWTILSIFIVAFFNSVFYALFEKLDG